MTLRANNQDHPLLFRGAVITPDRILEDGAVLVDKGRIVGVGGAIRHDPNVEVLATTGYIAPGFVDLHVHGGGGADFMDGTAEAFRTALDTHLSHGTTSIVPTTTVAAFDRIARVLDLSRSLMRESAPAPRVLGVHFYGPYFGKQAAGCHPTNTLADPEPSEYLPILDSGVLRTATIAPELPGARQFALACRQRGIRLNVGHSHATFEQVEAAVDWGARHADHLYCAMSDRARLRQSQVFPMRGGVFEATLFFDALTTEVIADGRHLDRSLLLLALKLKGPERLALVTDASRAVDCPDGEYVFGAIDDGSRFLRRDGVGVTLDGAALASSVMGMDTMVRTFRRMTGAPLADVIRMASLTPATIVGEESQIGSIEQGKRADLLILDRELNVQQVWVDGRKVIDQVERGGEN